MALAREEKHHLGDLVEVSRDPLATANVLNEGDPFPGRELYPRVHLTFLTLLILSRSLEGWKALESDPY